MVRLRRVGVPSVLVTLAAAATAAGIALPAAGAPAARAATADGPVVVQADAFTRDAPGLAAGQIEMTTISTRPTVVTGPDVRVAVRGLSSDDRLTVTRDGTDVSAAFASVPSRPGQAAGNHEGLVAGLHLGANHLVATATDATYGARTVALTVIDHSLQGPVLTGPHQEPFVCETEGSGLGPSNAPDCVVSPVVHWYAHNTQGSFVLLTDPYAPYPSGTTMTTAGGRRVPFVVRVQTEVINRSITRIGVLDDPHGRGRGSTFAPLSWNHRVVYHFGESCGSGFHQGSSNEADVMSSLNTISSENLAGPLMQLSDRLGQGYMVAQSTLTTFGVHCNEILSAETLMMVRERIIDDYGDVDHIIGGGASGGAIQQYTIANHYPGLLDAGTPLLSFPDVVTTSMTVTDCVLLNPVFQSDPNRWSLVKQVAITGLADPKVCADWQDDFGDLLQPTHCPGGIPKAQVYDPATNPHGVRCDLADDLINLLGKDPRLGHAALPVSNEGVQYGLAALSSGRISVADFLAVNQLAGGFDPDGHKVMTRSRMSDELAHRIFEYGFVDGTGALDETPIIDQTVPISDDVPALDIHDQIRPFEMRARLDRHFGSHASQAIWSGGPLPGNAILVADQWLDALDRLQAAHPDLTRAQLIARSRPAAAADQCRLGVTGVDDACDAGLLAHSSPRQVAGGPLSEDDIQCVLRPVRRSDYPSTVTDAQYAQIQATFPTGVCDYQQPSVGRTEDAKVWQSFGGTTLYPTPRTVGYALVRSGKLAVRAKTAHRHGPNGAVRPPSGSLAATGPNPLLPLTGAGLVAAAVAVLVRRRRT